MKKLLLVPVLVAALLGLLAAPALASPKTFYVHPSGGNDTKAIQATFNKAVAAGPGSVVQLSAGHFYVNAIWVKGFNGVFRGTGGLTVIDTPRAHDPSLAAVNDPSDPAAAHEPFAFLFGFSGGHLGISDMRVDVTANYPADAYAAGEFTGLTAVFDDFVVTGSASAAFHHVSFAAGPGDPQGIGCAVDGAISFQGDVVYDENPSDPLYGFPLHVGATGGIDSVSDCSFSGFVGIETTGFTDGTLTVGGSAAARNTFDDAFGGLQLIESSDSTFIVSHNRIASSEGNAILCDQGWVAFDSGLTDQLPPLPAPRFLIADNQISASAAGYSAVVLFDFDTYFDAAPRLNATIVGNTLALHNANGLCGIAEFGTRNVLCARNTLSGSASWGIYLGDDYDQNNQPVTVSGWQVLGNDFSGLAASVAPIVLGAGTTHNLVCPTPAGTIDNGVDNWLLDPLSGSARSVMHAASAAPLVPSKLRVLKEARPF